MNSIVLPFFVLLTVEVNLPPKKKERETLNTLIPPYP
jgi:uncharacterized membrane protein YagU involved in acid resistance